MTSIIKVNEIQDAGGNTILSSNGTGTFTSNLLVNTPAFEAYLSATQTVTNNVATKALIDVEFFDTDNCYDNITNYRFTPTVAGKYYVYANITMGSSASSAIASSFSFIYKNGSGYKYTRIDPTDNYANVNNVYVDAIIEMNGTSDYLEIYGNSNVSTGSSQFFIGLKSTYFGAYRIGV